MRLQTVTCRSVRCTSGSQSAAGSLIQADSLLHSWSNLIATRSSDLATRSDSPNSGSKSRSKPWVSASAPDCPSWSGSESSETGSSRGWSCLSPLLWTLPPTSTLRLNCPPSSGYRCWPPLTTCRPGCSEWGFSPLTSISRQTNSVFSQLCSA